MPVPSSGQLRLRADINQEVNGNDTDDNVSLGTLSNDAGFTDPDNMSEFYGYQACEIPDASGAYGINPSSADFNTSGVLSAYGFMRNNGGCNITDCGLYVGTSSNIANATKYSQFSSWSVYTYRYFSLSGFANNSSHHIWIYATNDAGTKTWYKGQQTVPPPVIPVTGNTETASGDWASANYCPNYNFIGGFSPIRWTNSTSYTNIDVYGNNSASAFQHATDNASYPGCKNTFGAFGAQSSQRTMYGGVLRYTCRDYSACGTTRYIYARYYYSGYSDLLVTTSRACPAC